VAGVYQIGDDQARSFGGLIRGEGQLVFDGEQSTPSGRRDFQHACVVNGWLCGVELRILPHRREDWGALDDFDDRMLPKQRP
jgi:hypothetical protein